MTDHSAKPTAPPPHILQCPHPALSSYVSNLARMRLTSPRTFRSIHTLMEQMYRGRGLRREHRAHVASRQAPSQKTPVPSHPRFPPWSTLREALDHTPPQIHTDTCVVVVGDGRGHGASVGDAAGPSVKCKWHAVGHPLVITSKSAVSMILWRS